MIIALLKVPNTLTKKTALINAHFRWLHLFLTHHQLLRIPPLPIPNPYQIQSLWQVCHINFMTGDAQ
jgi:hypothetical protein